MNAWRYHISHEIDVSKELEADFSFPKIHLMSHWGEQIHWYWAFQQYAAERHEHALQTILKDVWNASNHNHNSLPQVIDFQRRILCSEIRELNFKAVVQWRERNAAACTALPSSADLAPPLSPQSYAMPEFMGPQNGHDEQFPDDMIKDFRGLRDNTPDATHCVALYWGT